MKIRTFIDRPILSCVISVFILILGFLSLSNLPMEQFPDIAPPTITVSATYTGANAETVQKAVIAPLEEAINGVENMTYMTSTATNTGQATITVYFRQGTDPDMATVNIKNRVAEAEGLLPAEVTQIGVSVAKEQTAILKFIALYSPDDRFDQNFINNYLKINIEPRLSRIPGVGNVQVFGGDYAMRVWLDPKAMAQHGLVPADVTAALGTQNIEAPTGTLGEESDHTFQYTLKYRGRYETAEEFGNIVLKSLPTGEVLRLKDVARVELGALTYATDVRISGHPGSGAMITQVAGSNANEIITQIDRLVEELSDQLPEGLELADVLSAKEYLDASVKEVVKTLVLAIILVVLVVYLFLQSIRATVIPTAAIVVSLVGTFAFLYVAGFSLNLLTLFALVLVIGTVVDDAIVVVEAVQVKLDDGNRSPYEATTSAMSEITSAIITTTIVFMAVFIPTAFLGGTSGTFYMQFGLTMAVAVAISTVNALTLSPALCALLMKPQTGGKGFGARFHAAFDASFARLTARYTRGVQRMFRHKWLASGALVVAVALLALMLKTTKTGLVPDEDMGTVFVNVSTPPGSTLEQTNKALDEIEPLVCDFPQVELYSRMAGVSLIGGQAATSGMFILRLKPWEERKGWQNSIGMVIGQIYGRTANVGTAQVFAFAQPAIMGYGMGNGIELHIQDRTGSSMDKLDEYAKKFIGALNARPEVMMAYSMFDNKYPQYRVEVDAAQCLRSGITPTDVLGVLSGYIGGNYVSNVNRFSKLYRVMLQADKEFRVNKEALSNMFVRTGSGEMAPVGRFLKLTKVYGAETLDRFNMYGSIAVSVMPADGYSTGDVLAAINEISMQILPAGYGYELGGISREEADSDNTVLVFVLCIVFIYLILCALYESVFIPLAVLCSVPFGLLGSFLFARLFGVENNIYMQTGLIMLIGLLSKTAILLTEYASERRRRGMSIAEAALEATRVRLRPILMTALTMVIGLLPLLFASGAGAGGNLSLGAGAVGGMLVGTAALLFAVPVFFIVFRKIEERVMPHREIKK